MTRSCLVVALVIAAGCMKDSATYCAKHGADDPANCPPVDGAVSMCTSSNDCADTPGMLVCNTETGSCGECYAASSETSACGGSKPVCGDTDTCRGCRAHAECASEVCLPDGRCANPTDVAFVVGLPTPGSGSDCTQANPCDKVQTALAVMPARAFIKITGNLVEAVTINDHDVTLLGAPGARIANSSLDSTNLAIFGTSDVAVHDLQIGDGSTRTLGVRLDTSATGSLLLHRVRITDNVLGGISATGGQLSLQSSIVTDNARGGIVVRSSAGKFDIRNNFIYSNGTSSGGNASLFGGVLIENDFGSKLEFNTIAFNASTGLQNRPGIACYGASNSADGNLVYANREGAAGPDTALQIGGNCVAGTSYPLAMGDLGFRNPSLSTPDFHLTDASPTTVRDAGGNCQSRNDIDIDGQARPHGGACDVGADELTPP